MDHNTCPSCNQTPQAMRAECKDHFAGYDTRGGRLAAPCSRICVGREHPAVTIEQLQVWFQQSQAM